MCTLWIIRAVPSAGRLGHLPRAQQLGGAKLGISSKNNEKIKIQQGSEIQKHIKSELFKGQISNGRVFLCTFFNVLLELF